MHIALCARKKSSPRNAGLYGLCPLHMRYYTVTYADLCGLYALKLNTCVCGRK